ncbi:unnamed protein product [Mytilus coruscus]|uniref:Uncharacterized protein n=1 Tax=Mytilus coruscus TaxID=42192 RepID=A0A6J8CWE4_MYTCO|nr:unnamed protein product [Mytilus coruscus]
MINNHLDKLQEDLIKQLYAVEEKENSKIRQLLSKLEKKEKEISDKQRNIVNIKQHATDLQLFLSIKQIEEDVSSKDDILNSLVQDENLKNHSLEYKLYTAIQNTISDINSFRDIHIEEKPCEIVLNDRTVFTYYTESLVKVFSNEGLKEFQVKMPCNVYDIAYSSEDNTLAVTSGKSDKRCITIIDVEKKHIKKIISLDSITFGIALRENELIYSGYNKGIRMINLYDESISDIVQDRMPIECYIATVGNKIYHTNHVTNTVTCYDQQGKLQWTFHNESVL